MPKATAKDKQAAIEGEVLEVQEMQNQLMVLEADLMQLEPFQKFITLRKAVDDRMKLLRAGIEAVMVPAYQRGEVDKTIKGSWGSVTVRESDTFDISEKELPPKFWKKVPDTTKIRATYQLEGKAPKGTTHRKEYGIQIKFKEA